MKSIHNEEIVPQHIAVVMDGNRRWARERGLPVVEGHRQVATKVLEPLIEYAAKRGVKYMTFWAWSTENWQRDAKEVRGIMGLFRHVIADQWDRLHKNGVRVQTIGDIEKFPKDIYESLTKVVEQTKNNKKITAIFALNYGGRDEIVRAINKMANGKWQMVNGENESGSKGMGNGKREMGKISEQDLSNLLDTAGIPDPELIVRTGGEQRMSGFLLWQMQYAELYFPQWYMPEFTKEKLDEVIAEFNTRKRRFGK